MNVVLHGILPLLTLTAVLLVAVLPWLVASWTQRAVAVAVAWGHRPRLSPRPAGLTPIAVGSRRVPTDVVPAHQAWRAPPTVRPQSPEDDPAEMVGRRLG